MFRNYLAAALRNLLRNRLTAAVAIVGLAIGLAAALLIALYVRYEHSYDRFFPGHERVFRVSTIMNEQGQSPTIWDTTYYIVAERLKADFPEIELSARLVDDWRSVRRGPVEYHEQVYVADPDFFKIFPLRAVAGDLATALDAPDAIVMTRSMARKYFGKEDPIGGTVEFERAIPMRVTAVIEDLPGNTHLNFRMIVSGRSPYTSLGVFDAQADHPHYQIGAHTYVRLRDGASASELRRKLPEFLERHFSAEQRRASRLVLHAVHDVHLAPAGRWPQRPAGNLQTLASLSIVGVLIALIAVINFVNLMTARAAERSVEVAIRKVAGAHRRDLILQFMGESLLHVIVAMLVAMSIVECVLPYFNAMLSYAGEEINQAATVQFDYWRDPVLGGSLVLFTIALGLVAGAYPAFVTSAFRPAVALKRARLGGGSPSVRQALVTLQLATLIGLIFATVTIHRQTTFAMQEGLRIDADQVLLVHTQVPPTDAFLNSLRQLPGVRDVTGAQAAPTNFSVAAAPFRVDDGPKAVMRMTPVDANFFEFFDLRPLAGRTFRRERAADVLVANDPTRHWSVVLNETAVQSLHLGSPQEAIGKRISTADWPPNLPAPASITIIGVVADFPVDSMRSRVEPTLFGFDPQAIRLLSIRLDGQRIPETLQAIDALWARLGEPRAISRWFLEQYYSRLYADVLQQRRVLGLLSAVAVLLASLGLFGLSMFTAQRRTKEIGIRKVMGASSADMMKLLLWAFTKPIFLASLVAWPIALWAVHRWLNGFAYRVDLGIWLLPLASIVALVISLLTVSAHTYAVARSRPVEALRYE